MKNILKPILALCLCALVAVPVSAAIIVDGVLDADYGAPVVIQTVQTEFGDSDAANGT